MRHFSVILLSLVACAQGSPVTADTPPAADESEAALRPLQQSELLGEIVYGQKRGPFDYTGTPYYQALVFKGAAGDEVTVSVQSGGRAKAWLQDPQNSTLANDVAKTVGSAVVLKVRLSQDGAHYVVWREVEDEESNVTVALDKKPTPQTVSHVTLQALFDGSLKDGDNLAQADVVHFFAPAATQATLGGFVVRQRERQCNSVTGCADWLYPQKTSFYYYGNSGCSYNVRAFDELLGTLTLSIASTNAFDLKLGSTGFTTSCRFGYATCSTPSYAEGTCGSTYVAAEYGAGQPGSIQYVAFSTWFKKSYFYALSSLSSPADGQGSYRQAEYALFGSYTTGEQPSVDE
jgi:hypothetical protein